MGTWDILGQDSSISRKDSLQSTFQWRSTKVDFHVPYVFQHPISTSNFSCTPKTDRNCQTKVQKCMKLRKTCRDSLSLAFQLSHTTLQVELGVLYPMDIFAYRFDAPEGQKSQGSDQIFQIFRKTWDHSSSYTFQFSSTTFQVELNVLYPMDTFSTQFDTPNGRQMGNSDPNEQVFQDTRDDWGKFTFQLSNATFQLEFAALYPIDAFVTLFHAPMDTFVEQKVPNRGLNSWVSPESF